MHKKEIDISQIRKYLNGELDAKAMHQLERRAQDDPFLMDALEGYDHIRNNQQANLDELSERLKRRITPKGGRIILWKYLAAAASILVVVTVGGLLLYNRQPANKQRIADIVRPVATDTIAAAEKPRTEVQSKIAAPTPPPPVTYQQKSANNNIAFTPPVVMADMEASKPVTNVRPDSAYGYLAPPGNDVLKKTIFGNAVAAAPINIAPQDDVIRQADKALQGRAAGVIADNFSNTLRKKTQPNNLVTGRVIERDGGLPLRGATVMIAGTKVATVTNVDGFFTIRVDTSKDKLYIANLGYQSRQISAHNRDSLASIKLNPDDKALAEVVVVGYGSKKKDEDNAVVNGAHPGPGWTSFNKYLKESAVSPDGSTGVVKLSFNVAANGTISDIIVKKRLSKTADQTAIDLVNNGPAWIGNTNGQTEKVTVKVKFVRPK